MRGTVSLGPECSVCGEGSVCLLSVGRGKSLIGGPMSRRGVSLMPSFSFGPESLGGLPGGGT